jgi:hypothetical protein
MSGCRVTGIVQPTRAVVLFSGNSAHGQPDDTWTWNGKTWSQQHPVTSPHSRGLAEMT